MEKENNLIYKKAFDFSIEIVNICRKINKTKKEYALCNQLLRAGTSIGANISEGIEGQTKKDFIAKMSISLKEAAETEYWLKLFLATDIIDKNEADNLLTKVKEISRILAKILKTAKTNI